MSRSRVAVLAALLVGGGVSIATYGILGAILAGVVLLVAAALVFLVWGV